MECADEAETPRARNGLCSLLYAEFGPATRGAPGESGGARLGPDHIFLTPGIFKCGRTFAQPNEPSGNPRRKEMACAKFPSRFKKILRGASCAATIARAFRSSPTRSPP